MRKAAGSTSPTRWSATGRSTSSTSPAGSRTWSWPGSFPRAWLRAPRLDLASDPVRQGTGMSDPVAADELPTLEQRMGDVRAVMDAVGSERAAIFGASEGGNVSMLFAATYPERTIALCTFGSTAKRIRTPEYPSAPSWEERLKAFDH